MEKWVGCRLHQLMVFLKLWHPILDNKVVASTKISLVMLVIIV